MDLISCAHCLSTNGWSSASPPAASYGKTWLPEEIRGSPTLLLPTKGLTATSDVGLRSGESEACPEKNLKMFRSHWVTFTSVRRWARSWDLRERVRVEKTQVNGAKTGTNVPGKVGDTRGTVPSRCSPTGERGEQEGVRRGTQSRRGKVSSHLYQPPLPPRNPAPWG